MKGRHLFDSFCQALHFLGHFAAACALPLAGCVGRSFSPQLSHAPGLLHLPSVARPWVVTVWAVAGRAAAATVRPAPPSPPDHCIKAGCSLMQRPVC